MNATTQSRERRLSAVMREGERVTPLELFFDLVFVLALTQCTALMADPATWGHLLRGLLVLGVLCNVLVCLAVWLSFSARTTADRILAVVPPVAAFVAAGFEHSVANMYFIPLGLLIKAGAPDTFWSSIGQQPTGYAALTWERFLLGNLLPVTLGNVIGGAVLVGAVYWFVYLRPRRSLQRRRTPRQLRLARLPALRLRLRHQRRRSTANRRRVQSSPERTSRRSPCVTS